MVPMMTFAFVAGVLTALVGIAFSCWSIHNIRIGYDRFEGGIVFLGGLVIVVIGSCLMLPFVVTTLDL